LAIILPNIMTLTQHIFQLSIQPEKYRPPCCQACGKNKLWNHGTYTRKSNRRSLKFETDDPIMIPRFICPACQTTCSTLPEVIPPHRHYLWALQQAILLQLLNGVSLNQVAREWSPSLNTIRRWWQQLKDQFTIDESFLRSRFAELGRFPGFTSFWSNCLAKMALSSAMYHLNTMGRSVP